MPVFSTFSSLSKYGFANSASGDVPATFYLNVISNTHTLSLTSGVIASDGNVITAGVLYNSPPPSRAPIVREDRYGGITFQKELYTNTGGAQNDTSISEVLLGPANSIFLVGTFYPTSARVGDLLLVNVDPALNIAWQQTLYTNGTETTYCGGVGSSYIYVGGTANGNVALLVSYDFSGILNFQKSVGNNCSRVDSLFVDSSSNYYIIANEIAGAGVQGVQLMKWDNTNTYQWGRRITGASDIPFGQNTTDVVVDTSGNVYVSLVISATIYIVKYNSSGTLQWQKKIDTTINYLTGMAVDTNGDVYVLGLTDQTNLSPVLLFKFDNTGSIVWQRSIDGNLVTNNIFWSTQNSLHWRSGVLLINIVQSVSAGIRQSYVITLPDDGTLTGSYASIITYASTSYTISTSTLTDASQSDVSSTTTYTDATATALSANTSFTQSVTAL